MIGPVIRVTVMTVDSRLKRTINQNRNVSNLLNVSQNKIFPSKLCQTQSTELLCRLRLMPNCQK